MIIKKIVKKLKKKKKTKNLNKMPKVTIGWQEWCALPKLHLPAIKVKIDTGAKTSALHAWDVRPFHRQGELFVHFTLHPIQRNIRITKVCSARVVDQRNIMNTGGQKEKRYIIKTPITLGEMTWEIEVSLTNRDSMSFRMLLGRDALRGHLMVDPSKKLFQGKLSKKQIRQLYTKQHHNHPHYPHGVHSDKSNEK